MDTARSFNMGKTIIVDLGGTLAHRGARHKEEYLTRFNEDLVDITVRDLVNLEYSVGTIVVILTGQREKARSITENWLKENGVKYNNLLMKPNDYELNTLDFKREIYEELLADEMVIKYVLEDREEIVEMWRHHGIRCFQVASGQDREFYKQKGIATQNKNHDTRTAPNSNS